jgi:hypothetical protein
MISPDEITIWVHTCPKRLGSLREIVASLDASDAKGRYQILTCEEQGLENVERWTRETIKRLCKKTRFVLRLEDDVVVSPHLLHNVCNWPALGKATDFGVGLLYLHRMYREDTRLKHLIRRDQVSGSAWFENDRICGAQAVVYDAETYWSIYDQLPLMTGAEMDVGISFAVFEAGLRSYVHTPDLVRESDVAKSSELRHKHGADHTSSTFDPEWIREPSKFDHQTNGMFGAWFVNAKSEIIPIGIGRQVPEGSFVASSDSGPMVVKGSRVFLRREDALRLSPDGLGAFRRTGGSEGSPPKDRLVRPRRTHRAH